MLTPGIAFTQEGGRCGHGMGYYDKYFESLFKSYPNRWSDAELRGNLDEKLLQKKTILIALAFKEQIVPELPLDATDVFLDKIITSDLE